MAKEDAIEVEGTVTQALPNARCVLHPRGAPHMADPSKLVAGTEAVYGREQTRSMYGTLVPIPESRIDIAKDESRFELNGRELRSLHTEGHARHHYVLDDPASRGVFTGDSFGVSYREFDTARGAFIFPTATPIDFDPDAAHAACDRILGCAPEHVYLTHYSKVGDPERLAMDLHEDIEAFRRLAEDDFPGDGQDGFARTRNYWRRMFRFARTEDEECFFGALNRAGVAV